MPWSKPEDLIYDRQKPLPALGGIFNGQQTEFHGAHVVMADGSVHVVTPQTSEAALRAAISIDATNQVNLDSFGY